MRNGRFRLVGAVMVVLIGGSGCTGSSGGHPSPLPASTTTSSTPATSAPPPSPTRTTPTVPTSGPNVSPGEKPPVLGSRVEVNTGSGAVAFAAYSMDALDWGYATTSSVLYRRTYSAPCSECERFASIFDDVRRRGNHLRGGRIHQSSWSLVAPGRDHGATRAVDVTYSQAAVQEVDPAGGVVATDGALPHVLRRVWLRWAGTAWVVVDTKEVELR